MAAVTNNAPLRRDRITAPRIPAPAGSMAHLHAALTAPATSPSLKDLLEATDAAQAALDKHDAEVLKPLQAPGGDPVERARQIQVNNDLFEQCAHAEQYVAAFPVTTAADLHTKLTRMVEWNLGKGQDWLPELLADAARIMTREAQ